MPNSRRSTPTRPAGYDRDQLHEPDEALGVVKSLANRNFDETVEVAYRLGVDPRKADQMLRGTVSLPVGHRQGRAGRRVRRGRRRARGRGRGCRRRRRRRPRRSEIQNGFLDFDVAIATPDLMGQVGRLGRVLGPRGLMPNPKTGTVTTDVGKAVGEFKGGKVEYRTDRHGNVHVPIGKVSFDIDDLDGELPGRARRDRQRAKPAASKGRYIKSITTSSTMGPGVKINPEVKVVR